jgi:hypothetical protein
MGDVLQFRPLPKDGGKARIRRRREALALAISAKAILAKVDDLVMHTADPEETRPSDLA